MPITVGPPSVSMDPPGVSEGELTETVRVAICQTADGFGKEESIVWIGASTPMPERVTVEDAPELLAENRKRSGHSTGQAELLAQARCGQK